MSFAGLALLDAPIKHNGVELVLPVLNKLAGAFDERCRGDIAATDADDQLVTLFKCFLEEKTSYLKRLAHDDPTRAMNVNAAAQDPRAEKMRDALGFLPVQFQDGRKDPTDGFKRWQTIVEMALIFCDGKTEGAYARGGGVLKPVELPVETSKEHGGILGLRQGLEEANSLFYNACASIEEICEHRKALAEAVRNVKPTSPSKLNPMRIG